MEVVVDGVDRFIGGFLVEGWASLDQGKSDGMAPGLRPNLIKGLPLLSVLSNGRNESSEK